MTTRIVPLRVLIVDDQRDAAETLSVLVRKWGYEPRVAYDGGQALACADEFQPHVVLLDIILPGMNGAAVAGALHQRPWAAEAVIFAVSGYPQKAKKAYLGQALFDDYFLKPVEPVVLEQVLRAEHVRLLQLGKLTSATAREG